MPKPYTLTAKQLTLLNLLYRFRFATSDLFSQSTGITKSTINKRLQLLVEQNYISRKYEPEYHLLRKHATYYLVSSGLKALKQINPKKYNQSVLRIICNDLNASEDFINHNLNVYRAYCDLRAQFGADLQFFTKTQLAPFEYFPQPLPDAYVQVTRNSETKSFFLHCLYAHRPFFTATKILFKYRGYSENGDWPADQSLPKILLWCDQKSLQVKLVKKMRTFAEELDDPDLTFYIGGEKQITYAQWQNLAAPDKSLTLQDIQ